MFLCPKPSWRWSNNVRPSCDSLPGLPPSSLPGVFLLSFLMLTISCSLSCFFYMLYQMCQMMELPFQEYAKQQKYWALPWTRNQYRQKQSRVQMKNTWQKQFGSCRNCCNNNKQENPHGKQFQANPSWVYSWMQESKKLCPMIRVFHQSIRAGHLRFRLSVQIWEQLSQCERERPTSYLHRRGGILSPEVYSDCKLSKSLEHID